MGETSTGGTVSNEVKALNARINAKIKVNVILLDFIAYKMMLWGIR